MCEPVQITIPLIDFDDPETQCLAAMMALLEREWPIERLGREQKARITAYLSQRYTRGADDGN